MRFSLTVLGLVSISFEMLCLAMKFTIVSSSPVINTYFLCEIDFRVKFLKRYLQFLYISAIEVPVFKARLMTLNLLCPEQDVNKMAA